MSAPFIKPGTALFAVIAIGLAAAVLVGAEGDEDSLVQTGKERAVAAVGVNAQSHEIAPEDRRMHGPKDRPTGHSDSAGDFTREEELVDSAAGEAPRGYEIEPSLDGSVPHKIDPEAEAKENARRIAEDDDAVALPPVPGRIRQADAGD